MLLNGCGYGCCEVGDVENVLNHDVDLLQSPSPYACPGPVLYLYLCPFLYLYRRDGLCRFYDNYLAETLLGIGPCLSNRSGVVYRPDVRRSPCFYRAFRLHSWYAHPSYLSDHPSPVCLLVHHHLSHPMIA